MVNTGFHTFTCKDSLAAGPGTWASYYNGLDLTPGKSFADFSRNGKRLYDKEDAARLDRLKGVLFNCFEPASVANATASLKRAKELGEPCPFPEESLNALFGKPLK